MVTTHNNSIRWPEWPLCDDETLRFASEALTSGRWAISGPVVEQASFERRFAAAWAAHLGAAHCIATNSGSAGLTIALEALGIGYGDEVLIPALTWVACASTVANLNAIPVLVDVDPATLCMDPVDAERKITANTRAIMPVHLYGSLADMDAMEDLARRKAIAILEDGSHSHGAAWDHRAVGTIGRCGVFSMQQSKLLTGGEGGAVVTNDSGLAAKLEQLRADSRRRVEHAEIGASELAPGGLMQGNNYCMSELHAAVLLSELNKLEARNKTREAGAAFLDRALAAIDGIQPQAVSPRVTRRAAYYYVFRCEPAKFGCSTIDEVRAELARRTGIALERIYPSLAASPLWLPASKRRYHLSRDHIEALSFGASVCPASDAASASCLSLHHRYLLADCRDLAILPEALKAMRAGSP